MNHLGLYSSYNSCTGVSLSSHRLSSLKAVVRNKFLTTALRLDYTRYCCYYGPNDSSDLLV